MAEGTYLERLKRKAARLTGRSPGVEAMPTAAAPAGLAPGVEPGIVLEAFGRAESAQLEAVIRWYRPVLAVANDRFVPNADGDFAEDPNATASRALVETLEANRSTLDPAIRSVGRIELANNLQFPWVGTAWIVGSELGDDIVVTNAHVAREFGQRSATGFVFRPGTPDFSLPQSAVVDFREELGSATPREFPVTDIIWISEVPGLDMGLLRVARTAGNDRIDPPIAVFVDEPAEDRMLTVVGYPGSNNGYDPEPFRRLFGNVLGKKRFSPGFYEGMRESSVTYDCSTLPGSSGSVVLDVTTGQAIGLHFAGTAFDTNYAVPGRQVAKILRDRPWVGDAAPKPVASLGDAAESSQAPVAVRAAAPAPAKITDATGSVTVVLPLEITVRLGQSLSGGPVVAAGPAEPSTATPTDRSSAEAAASRVRERLARNPDVVGVRAGCVFRDGRATDAFGVTVSVLPHVSRHSADYGLDDTLDGIPIAIVGGSVDEIVAAEQGPLLEAFQGRKANYERDLSDPRFDLSPVTDAMRIVLHVSPEAGWPVLKQFLAERRFEQLTIGMYHMTAPHVVEAIADVAKRPDSRITLSLDRQRANAATAPDDITGGTKKNDIVERETLENLEEIAGDRFRWAPASLGAAGLFASSYHIKVAVWSDGEPGNLDDKTVWLSSGNWQSSNQPPVARTIDDIDGTMWDEIKDYNREWHAVVENRRIAKVFRNHLEQDFNDNSQAAQVEGRGAELPDVIVPEAFLESPRRPSRYRPFAPLVIEGDVTVQPLLTPDNYPEVVLELIEAAEDRILVQNQSFNLWSKIERTPKHFMDIAKALVAKQQAGLDVRIIFRSGFGKTRFRVDQMVSLGFDPRRIRFFGHNHTKGFVFDCNKVILGSHNLSGGGVGPNRDASLLIDHPAANAYFATLFKYDWAEMAADLLPADERLPAPIRILPAGAEAPVPQGFRRISLAELVGET